MLWRIHPEVKGFKTCHVEGKDLRRLMGMNCHFHFNPSPIEYLLTWKTPPLVIGSYGKGPKKTRIPDVSIRTGKIYMNPKAYLIYKELLTGLGEFLPVHWENETHYFFNPLKIAENFDALNKKVCSVDSFGVPQSLDFYENKLKGVTVFKSSFDHYMGVYCLDEFRDIYIKNNLTGIQFESDLASCFPHRKSKKAKKNLDS